MAEKNCRQALARAGFSISPLPPSFHWSQLINPAGDKTSAEKAYGCLLETEPRNKAALEGLSYLYQIKGELNNAIRLRDKLYRLEAEEAGFSGQILEEVVACRLAQIGAAAQPNHLPSQYIEHHFDQYAGNFDQHLIRHLQYRAPEYIKNLITDSVYALQKKSVLDLGCGTGLVGKALADKISVIDGIDLSSKMLALARQQDIYRQLIQGDLRKVMSQLKNRYDIIIAADVFIYVGELTSVFQCTSEVLKDKGLFVFSVEKNETEDLSLRSSGRYQHSFSYIKNLSDVFGFELTKYQEVILRFDDTLPVNGYVFILQKI